MDTKRKSYLQSTQRRVLGAVLIAGLLTAVAGHAQVDKAKGEEMLRHARVDLAEANRLSEAAISAQQRAQEEQAAATQKRDDAVKLQRQAYLLIGDANRMRAAELRSRATELDLKVKADNVQLAHLKAQSNHALKLSSALNADSANIRALANQQSDANQKAELNRSADLLDKQSAQAVTEAETFNPGIQSMTTEISDYGRQIDEYRKGADRLAPEEK